MRVLTESQPMYIEEQIGLERADGGKVLLALVGPAGFDSLDNNPFPRNPLKGYNSMGSTF